MTRTTIVTEQTKRLIAYQTLKSGSDIITKRIDRKFKPLAQEVYDRLKKRQKISQGSPIVADYRFENQDKARTLTEGIKEFSQRHPEYGNKLQNIIDETRKTKKRYLVYGTTQDLPDEIYQQVFEDIGIPSNMQGGLMQNIRAVSQEFSKKREDGLFETLIK